MELTNEECLLILSLLEKVDDEVFSKYKVNKNRFNQILSLLRKSTTTIKIEDN